MAIKLNPDGRSFHERRDDYQRPKVQSSVNHLLSEVGEVVFVGPSDFLNEAMHSETFVYQSKGALMQ